MNPTLREQFERLGLRLTELDANLSDPQVLADINRYRSLSREQAEVAQVVQQFRQYQQRERDLQAGREMLADPEMAEMAARGGRRRAGRPGAAAGRAAGRRCCRATRTTRATPSWRSAPAPAATNRRCSPATWRACTCATASAAAGAPR